MKSEEYLQVINTLTAEGLAPRQIASKLKDFLHRRRSLHTLSDIVHSHDQKVRFGYNPEVIKIETAQDVSHKTLEGIKKYVGASSDTDTRHRVDAGHIGGFRVMYRDQLLDTTLESKLKALRNHLLKI